MVLTAAEARTRGDATGEQRAEIHALLAVKAVDPKWLRTFFTAVRRAEGLSTGAAEDALLYLGSLAERDQQPELATAAQHDAMRQLVRTRIVPGPPARAMLARYREEKLTYIQADRALREWLGLPRRAVVAAATLPAGASVAAPDGYFAVTIADGTVRCYRIFTRAATGRRVVRQIVNEAGKTRDLHGPEAYAVLREVAANRAQAAALYGKTRRHCSACNQPLWDEEQEGYPHGYGPDCWTDIQAMEETDGHHH